MRNTIIGVCLVVLSGCAATANVKPAIDAYASVIKENTEGSRILLTRCQAGEKPACAAVDNALVAIGKSADALKSAAPSQ